MIATTQASANALDGPASRARRRGAGPHPGRAAVRDSIARVEATLAPVWPLRDYVAVNPFLGLTAATFGAARERLRRCSDVEPLMPMAHFAERFAAGAFTEDHVRTAAAELSGDGAARIGAEEALARLGDHAPGAGPDPSRGRSIVARFDAADGSGWLDLVREEIGRHLGAHYDRGQAAWPSPYRDLEPFAAWRRTLAHDRRADLLGIGAVRDLAGALPDDPREAVASLVPWIAAPADALDDYLLALLLETPGWAAWARHRSAWSGEGDGSDVAALLAIRLAYEVAFAERRGLLVAWPDSEGEGARERRLDGEARLVLQTALEVAYRERLIGDLDRAASTASAAPPAPTAQWVMCIDVRSERLRRHLEAAHPGVETHGFAGFFGQPIAIERPGGTTAQVPVLVQPSLTVPEGVRGAERNDDDARGARRHRLRVRRIAWKRFRAAGVAALGFVEAAGLLFLPRLVARALGLHPAPTDPRHDGVGRRVRDAFGPDLAGVPVEERVALAAGLLRGIGIADGLARVVVLCGHASTSANNPLRASLDCGACGGHSGEPNARFAATLLSDPGVRGGLADLGIHVPEDTIFLPATHDTTTDEVRFHDLDLVPASHADEVAALRQAAAGAGHRTRAERLPSLRAKRSADVWRRARDWAEVRPEWGLAGNAAFVIGPRSATRGLDLDGRAFLHSYAAERDPDGAVLETILTAPLVVASWINLQYYGSAADPEQLGSGSKTLHNVVGGFGVHAGGGGDLGFGLPLESVAHAGGFHHEPQRLLAIVHAPRDSVAAIVRAHVELFHLVTNGWVHLVVREGRRSWRLDARGTWRALAADGAGPVRASEVPGDHERTRPTERVMTETDRTPESGGATDLTEALDAAARARGGALERIIVVEDEPMAIARLEGSLEDAVVLPVARSRWSANSGPLTEIIDWAAVPGRVSRLLLVDVTARRDAASFGAKHVVDRSRLASRMRRVRREALVDLGIQLHASGGAAERLAAAGVELGILMQHAEAGCVSAFTPGTNTLEVIARAGA